MGWKFFWPTALILVGLFVILRRRTKVNPWSAAGPVNVCAPPAIPSTAWDPLIQRQIPNHYHLAE
jgi:hypothetical protein